MTSWIIIRKSDNKAVMETYNIRTVQAINQEAYQVVPVMDYLVSINGVVK